MKKKLLAMGLILAMTFSMVACSSAKEVNRDAEETKTETTTETTTTETNGATASTKEVKNPYVDDIKIAYVAHDISTPVNQAWLEGIQRECEYYPNITIQSFNGDSSAENQVKIMSEVINQDYDAIIIQCSDGAALADSVAQAESAGIPVITLNLDADTTHSALVQMVDYDAGRLIADKIAEEIGQEGNIVVIQGIAGVSRTDNLEQGFRDTMEKSYPNIKIVASQAADFEKEKATTVMTSFLSQFSDIKAVFAINDAMAEGASLAVQNAGRLNDMVIWGADGEKDALAMIEEGTLTGTIYTNCWDQGSTAAKIALLMIGSEYDSSVLSKTPQVIMEPVIATKDTVGEIAAEDRW
ncbi:monosaccharide ABC transporter substrate-binding protein (CUT2 family) [Lachnotalea glycerini]|uniref:Monosaccharide ABC transporter substrate-binding protein (CUT2 family) n=1 Tax=Lachnotalea glycerini TaxID=1763509 RepID=A0A318ELF5_9FIRM|nr:sugar ABC transporter substrate-binding protein [Lachnotalea glycerini]OYO59643.1 sugar ABC transporter substrate-binding protein [Lachnotalea glycerini]PXV84900.1 monosaccharide ABC transporter substrate-binding protein (CUT2 family) [Lachnotalea glycerini]